MLPSASFELAPCDPALARELRRELGCTETLAWMLARRGLTPERARALITDDPAEDERHMHDPFLLGDMAAAVERIRFAIEQREQIVVHGDYDADGVCSTTLLVEGLEAIGATEVVAFLPDRFENGYGLQIDQVERFARGGAKLLIAVDCGITAVEAVAHANDHGLDVIICDHHRPGPELPDAILCSTRPSDYPFPDLCATAVAGKLIQALGGPSGPRQHELEAIATVADCVPMVDENRALVRRGLRALRTTDRPGLLALIEQTGARPREVDAETIGFKIAPRINAVGRIAQSELAYELLRSDAAHAPGLAADVDATNERRREIERAISAEAIEQVEGWSDHQRDARIYVVHGHGWHEGVVGIVASRLVEKYYRPVIVIADGEPARGSGRSIDGVDLHAAIGTCDDLLLRWGGHAQAAGITVDQGQIDQLQARLRTWGETNIPDSLLSPCDKIDAVVASSELRMELVQELDRLAPFGTGWEQPTLLAVDANVIETRPVGGDGTHLKFVLAVGDERVPGIGFGMAALIPALAGTRVDAAVRPSINRFRGVESLQVHLERVYAVPTDEARVAGWTTEEMGIDGADAVTIDTILGAATGLVPSDIADADPDQPPALEPLLARPDTNDLRHRGHSGPEHIAQLLGAGATVAVVVADVDRRAPLLRGLAHPDRFGTVAAMLAGERCSALALRSRLHAVARAAGAPRLIVCDAQVLADHVLAPDSPLTLDAIVVLDPPTVTAHRDVLAGAKAPLHLTFGAAEQRWAGDVLRAALDVRGTLADAWRTLRDGGPLGSDALAIALRGAGDYSHPPSAVVHGLRTLLERGLLSLDVTGKLAVAAAHVPVASRDA